MAGNVGLARFARQAGEAMRLPDWQLAREGAGRVRDLRASIERLGAALNSLPELVQEAALARSVEGKGDPGSDA